MSKSNKSGKRKVDGVDEAQLPDKKNKTETPFETGTTESKWSSSADRDYVLRYIHGETCCDAPYDDIEGWPVMTLPKSIEWPDDDEEDDEEDEEEDKGADEINYIVIGAVWTAEGQLVGIWGQSEEDSHVNFYVTDGYEHAEEDLNEVTGVLCGTICSELRDVFDDGSGINREITKVPAELFVQADLDNLYKA